MAIAQYHKEFYNMSNSKTTSSSVTTVFAKEVSTIFFIKSGLLLPLSSSKTYAKVLQTFYIELIATEDGYVATSPIADIYEQDAIAGGTVRKYLYSLVDELLWLQEQRENVSNVIRKQLENIQLYISVV